MLDFIEAKTSMMEQIQDQQFDNDRLREISNRVLSGEAKETFLDFDSILKNSS